MPLNFCRNPQLRALKGGQAPAYLAYRTPLIPVCIQHDHFREPIGLIAIDKTEGVKRFFHERKNVYDIISVLKLRHISRNAQEQRHRARHAQHERIVGAADRLSDLADRDDRHLVDGDL